MDLHRARMDRLRNFSSLQMCGDVCVSVVAHPAGPRLESTLADGYIVKATSQFNFQGSSADVSSIHLNICTRGNRVDACMDFAGRSLLAKESRCHG